MGPAGGGGQRDRLDQGAGRGVFVEEDRVARGHERGCAGAHAVDDDVAGRERRRGQARRAECGADGKGGTEPANGGGGPQMTSAGIMDAGGQSVLAVSVHDDHGSTTSSPGKSKSALFRVANRSS